MKQCMKFWLIFATSLFLVGAILFGGAMTAMNWNFLKLAREDYETNRYEITESYRNILLDTQTADIELLPSADGKTTVVCQEWEKTRHTVRVSDNALVIRMEDDRAWHEHISVRTKSPKITVYVPFFFMQGEVNIHATTGNVKISDLAAFNVSVKLTTGDVEMENISCVNLSVQTTTGDIDLENVIAQESITLKATTGDIEFDSCDGANIFANATTGDVEGSLLTGKIFIVDNTTGDIQVPQSSGRGTCQITVTTGDIHISVK